MVWPENEAASMGHDQPHKTDQSTHRDRCGRDERCKEIRDQPQPLHVNTQLQSVFFSKEDDIEVSGLEIDDDKSNQDIRENREEGLRGG